MRYTISWTWPCTYQEHAQPMNGRMMMQPMTQANTQSSTFEVQTIQLSK